MIKLTAIQLSSVANVESNLAKISTLLAEITDNINTTDKVEHLVVLPECCFLFLR